MMLTVSKACHFDAAHILTHHAGECKNLHGHTYRVVAEVAQAPGDTADMVIDFHDLKTVLHEVVVARFDHAFLFDEASPSECEIASVLAKHGMKQVGFPFRTTAENLARFIYRELAQRVRVVAVKIYESPDSCAEYQETP